MGTAGCETCIARDYETVNEAGVYACYGCKTVFWMVAADEDPAKIAEANKDSDEFLQKHPDWKEA